MIKYKTVDDKFSIGYRVYHEESPDSYIAVIRRIDLGAGLSAFALIGWFGKGLTRLAEVRRFHELMREALLTAELLESRRSVEDFRQHASSS